jgi:uncharacterized protein (DUF1919 family)
VLSIVSNNCWGAGLYEEARRPYDTPTVGLYFHADDYIRFLRNLRVCTAQELRFSSLAPIYPIGVLDTSDGDVEIHFLHYATEDAAYGAWTRRTPRLPKSDDDLLVKICDRDGFEERHLELFDALPYRNKIGFARRGRFPTASRYSWLTEIDESENGLTVPNGVRLWELTREHAKARIAEIERASRTGSIAGGDWGCSGDPIAGRAATALPLYYLRSRGFGVASDLASKP